MDEDEEVTLKLSSLNKFLTCRLCNGYLIDPVSITECLHTFCRSCILMYLEEGDHLTCPTCDTLIHESQPKQHIIMDSTMQDIVLKLVPGLRKRELQREEEFYMRKNLKWPKAEIIAAEKEAEEKKRKLEMSQNGGAVDEKSGTGDMCNGDDVPNGEGVDPQAEDYHRSDPQIRFVLEPVKEDSGANQLDELDQKYVLCSEHTPVSAVKMVICRKLGIHNSNQIDLLCEGSRLGKDHSMKFVYMTRWRGKIFCAVLIEMALKRFHVWPHWAVMLLISLGMAYITTLALLSPGDKHLDAWSALLSTNYHWYIVRTAAVAWFIHMSTAFVAFVVGKRKGLHPADISTWFLSCFLFGNFSLYYLIKFDPKSAPSGGAKPKKSGSANSGTPYKPNHGYQTRSKKIN